MSTKTKKWLRWAWPLWLGAAILGFLGGFVAYWPSWRHGASWASIAFALVFTMTMSSFAGSRR